MSNNTKAFMEIARIESVYRPIDERKNDFLEVERPLTEAELTRQALRCMNCGVPFCHGIGCPLGNLIPDFNAAAARGDWRFAWELLSSTSNFPELTSRVCPALCEGSCAAGLDFGAVNIRQIEKMIVETAFQNGWVRPFLPERRTGKKVAVVGSGPAGLAVAVELNRRGHSVTVYEKNERPGGLLRYGIPDFKLSKTVVERRLLLMRESGIDFVCRTEIGNDVSAKYIAERNDVVVLAIGNPIPRDLDVPGRDLSGVYFALDFLSGQNRACSNEAVLPPISAKGKNVLVVGGGDTGSDCVGTSLRQGAKSVLQIEIMPQPPLTRSESTPWPYWPYMARTSSSRQEGGSARFALNTLRFLGENGKLTAADVIPVRWSFNKNGKPLKSDLANDREIERIDCDLVFLALGFLKFDRKQLLERLNLADDKKIFVAGDAASGPSLVVRAIADGRKVAESVSRFVFPNVVMER